MLLAARVTVTLYVFVVVVSGAVITTVISFSPTFRFTASLAALPFTIMVAVISSPVGVKVMLITSLPTLAV
ncbi:hypothetical protein D3C86_1955390 [compost metagenome]